MVGIQLNKFLEVGKVTENEAIKWITELFEESIDNIKPETRRDEIQSWDSLGVLNLIAGLDQQFDVLLAEDEVTGLKKVGDILEILKKYGKLS